MQVRAVSTDGTTSIAGTYAFAYNGLPGNPLNAGTYQALVIFTSLDPSYDNATSDELHHPKGDAHIQLPQLTGHHGRGRPGGPLGLHQCRLRGPDR